MCKCPQATTILLKPDGRKLMVKTTKTKDVETIKKALTIGDRFAIISLLPKEEDIITMLMVKDIEIRMLLTEAEKKKQNFRIRKDVITKNVLWEWDFPERTKTFTFSNAEIELLRSRIDKLDKQKKIGAKILDTCILLRK